ncbi:hypothetical protein CDD80_1283 [Ophiocordyceps camponoti-rufipedis]|uniref:Uncharacterized protein n=1 Tax=Ophiocordyceps camponoti-rufipedis TaxID=2004952 RepID=A0A2C5ZKF7_9HYPO|nr:hypothetical protein CDD80_1283 [Ophiocordyceps camponoti-rufipedis]
MKTAAESPPTEDDVYPVHLLDGTKLFRSLLVCYVFRFNHVLDAQKLHASLSTLLEIGDWRKLGGRLRLKEDGRLEIHVPRPFTLQRPAVLFTHQKLDSSIETHPAGRHLAKPSNSCSSNRHNQSQIEAFAQRPDSPRSVKDLIEKEMPQLSLHVTSFNDATVIALLWPHTLMDAAGLNLLLTKWSLVLHGKGQDVSPVACARQDMLEQAELQSHEEREEPVVNRLRPGLFGLIVMVARIVWHKMCRTTYETRTIMLSGHDVLQLRQLAERDISSQLEKEDGKALVSESDVLAAWGAKLAASSQQKSRPITIYSYINARFRLPFFRSTPDKECIQNMILIAYASLSAQTATEPLGRLALSHRRQVAEQSTTQQTLAYFAMQRKHAKSHQTTRVLFGDPSANTLNFNNLTKFDLFRAMDFSPAVAAGQQDTAGGNPPGTVVVFYPLVLNDTPSMDMLCVLGKDDADNCLMVGSFLPRTWVKIEMELQRLQSS